MINLSTYKLEGNKLSRQSKSSKARIGAVKTRIKTWPSAGLKIMVEISGALHCLPTCSLLRLAGYTFGPTLLRSCHGARRRICRSGSRVFDRWVYVKPLPLGHQHHAWSIAQHHEALPRRHAPHHRPVSSCWLNKYST